jgi:hypothetical protein
MIEERNHPFPEVKALPALTRGGKVTGSGAECQGRMVQKVAAGLRCGSGQWKLEKDDPPPTTYGHGLRTVKQFLLPAERGLIQL